MTLVRPSRRPRSLSSGRPEAGPGGGLLRMTFFLNAIINLRHPEEARSAVSKSARRACYVRIRHPPEFAALHRGWLYTPGMTSFAIARFCSGRVHYAWIVLGVMFTATLAGVGVRAAPGVMIVPLERAFGWDVGTISAAISINIILMGATGPFITGFMEVFGLKRTIILGLVLLTAGAGRSIWMTEPWQLFLTWGLMVGLGCGAGAISIGAAVANR